MRSRCTKHLTFFNGATHSAGAEKLCSCFDLEVHRQVHQQWLPVHSQCIAWFLVVVSRVDQNVVKRVDEAPAIRIPRVLSRTKVQEQNFARLVRHSLRCLIARTMPKGVEDFLNTYAQKRYDVDQG